MVNGTLVEPIIPGRGLHQGDPISPFIYSSFVRRDCPPWFVMHKVEATFVVLLFEKCINHVSFIICGWLIPLLRSMWKQGGSNYEYFSYVWSNIRELIANTLRVQQVLGTCKYLGFPSKIWRSKKATFMFVQDKIRIRLIHRVVVASYKQEERFSSNHYFNLYIHM